MGASGLGLECVNTVNAAGTERELFAEVFHQINDIILCESSPIYARALRLS